MILALCLAVAGWSAHAQLDPAMAGDTYRVSLEVTRGGSFVGAPFLVMVEGKREKIELRHGADTIILEPLLDVRSSSADLDTIVTIANQTWRPIVGVSYGSERAVTVDNMRIKVKIEPIGTSES